MPNMSSPDVFLAIEAAMTFEQRDLFLEQFLRINPNQRGIHVADAIDILSNMDAHLEYTEPLYEANRDEITEDLFGFVTPATIALIYVTRELQTVSCHWCKGEGTVSGSALFVGHDCLTCKGVGTITQPVPPTWDEVSSLARRATMEVGA